MDQNAVVRSFVGAALLAIIIVGSFWFGVSYEQSRFETEAKLHYWGWWNPVQRRWEWDDEADRGPGSRPPDSLQPKIIR